ncbi:hypothetical protein [Gemmata sp.]|uniref:hypothetical protein n=1 Tax=Gemmata sp. TaxID=1914242 RepID=UPI003F6EE6DA
MGPTELLVVNVFQDIVRLSLVAVAIVCVSLAYLVLRLKRGDENSTDLTMERAGVKIQVLKVGPFIVFVAVAAFCLYQACNANLSRQTAAQPYEMSTSYRLATPETSSARIPSPGVPVRPDDNPAGNQRGR